MYVKMVLLKYVSHAFSHVLEWFALLRQWVNVCVWQDSFFCIMCIMTTTKIKETITTANWQEQKISQSLMHAARNERETKKKAHDEEKFHISKRCGPFKYTLNVYYITHTHTTDEHGMLYIYVIVCVRSFSITHQTTG